ncbi:hypothetical protein MRB53_028611 [Persea americana]|uniref:Uncharacterized protein n=1 Tax=Persea americana TaxID=3435 RepID=A0ACC2KG21_PERAE|nr:hypothetical protein MRB53_028611 [Persea americana]
MDNAKGRNHVRSLKIVLRRPLYRSTTKSLVTESLSSSGRTSKINLGPSDLGMPIMEEIFSVVTTSSPCENLIVNEFAVEGQMDSYRPWIVEA